MQALHFQMALPFEKNFVISGELKDVIFMSFYSLMLLGLVEQNSEHSAH